MAFHKENNATGTFIFIRLFIAKNYDCNLILCILLNMRKLKLKFCKHKIVWMPWPSIICIIHKKKYLHLQPLQDSETWIERRLCEKNIIQNNKKKQHLFNSTGFFLIKFIISEYQLQDCHKKERFCVKNKSSVSAVVHLKILFTHILTI